MRSRLKDAVVVADMRGIWPEELLHARGYDSVAAAAPDEAAMQSYRYALSRIRDALEGADAMLAVSGALVSWVDEHALERPPAAVVPCCVSRVGSDAGVRDQVRTELGLTGKTVLCYVGSAERYQHLEDGFARFCSMAVALRGPDRVHVLCLTPAVDRVSAILAEAGISPSATTVLQVPQAKVGGYLPAADAGFLLRDGSSVNRVSVPVKLGEYLAAGVPVVTSSLLEWTRELLHGSSASIAVEWFGVSEDERGRQVEQVLTLLSQNHPTLRAEALSLARRRFTWRAHVESVRETYRTALRARSLVRVAPRTRAYQ
jgi:glycosyltransferase involved in cell wall biosynthesis